MRWYINNKKLKEMEDTIEEKISVYELIIKDYIKMINSQLHIVPISNNIVSAQVLADSKQVDAYAEKHGKKIDEDGKKGYRMSVEHGMVFERMMRNLNSSIQAFSMVGTNAVIGMVSKYDGFLGRLTRQMFEDKPEILSTSDKEFKASDILNYADLNELKELIAEKEVETLLRKSHTDQLKTLEGKFGVKLEPTKVLPEFVEIMERRNLFVHCNGVVSRQYLSECKKFGYKIPDDLKAGAVLKADMEYVENAYRVVFLVGIMLGYVLWYKMRPNEGKDLINSISAVAYDLIKDDQYELALDVIDFALQNKSWNKEIIHVHTLVFRINKALSFHLRGLQDECVKIVDSIDVTGAEPVFHLAVAVLKNEYEKAYAIMDRIGRDPELRVDYKIWPLFTNIRKEKAFIDKYRDIYQEEYECEEARSSKFEDVIKSAMAMVEKLNMEETTEMQDGEAEVVEEVGEEQQTEIESAVSE